MCVFQEGEPAVSTETHECIAYTYTTTRPTTNLLPELLLILQTRSPCRIISIERKMDERNNIIEQVDIRKISVENNINMEECNNIIELLKRPWNWDGWALKDASEDMKGDREIVMAAVKQNGDALECISRRAAGSLNRKTRTHCLHLHNNTADNKSPPRTPSHRQDYIPL